jgi:hypothetical protein
MQRYTASAVELADGSMWSVEACVALLLAGILYRVEFGVMCVQRVVGVSEGMCGGHVWLSDWLLLSFGRSPCHL